MEPQSAVGLGTLLTEPTDGWRVTNGSIIRPLSQSPRQVKAPRLGTAGSAPESEPSRGRPPDADPRGQPDIDRLVSEALEKYTERLLDQLVPSLTTKITEQVMNQIVSRVTSEAKGQVAALSGSLQGSIDSLDSKVADLQQKFTAVEEKQLQPVPSVENVSARLENLQANTSATHCHERALGRAFL